MRPLIAPLLGLVLSGVSAAVAQPVDLSFGATRCTQMINDPLVQNRAIAWAGKWLLEQEDGAIIIDMADLNAERVSFHLQRYCQEHPLNQLYDGMAQLYGQSAIDQLHKTSIRLKRGF
jgi:hypothetical protein